MEDALVFIAGVLAGLLSGLVPALHANFVISVLSSIGIDEDTLAILIIALFPANLIASFIPSIFFGIPEEGTVVAVLPGQRMVREGRGLEALKTVIFSILLGTVLSVAFFVPSLSIFPLLYGALKEHMGYILLAASAILLLRSKRPAYSLLFFISSGLLGAFTLDGAMPDPFLPLFSGMFALAAIAAYKPARVPHQKDEGIGFSFIKYTILGVFLGFLSDLIPGIGSPSQVATFASILMPIGSLGYLASISAISVSQAVFSLATSASIGKSRMGATAMLAEAIDIEGNLLLLLVLFLLSMAISAGLIYLARKRIASIASLDHSIMNAVLACYLMAVTFILDGGVGILVMILATALGFMALKMDVERTTLMGALIIPTLLLLFGIRA